MNKTLQIAAAIISLSTLVGVANAATPGSYVGLGLGGSAIETPKEMFSDTGINSNSRTIGGFGGRAFAGYNFNEFFGLEGGYAHFAKTKYKGSSAATTTDSTLEYGMSDVNLVAKAYLPLLDNSFNLYALGGAAYVWSTSDYKNNYVPLASGVVSPSEGNSTIKNIRPTYGVGVSYNVPQSNVVAGVEYSRVQGVGNVKTDTNAIPSADLATFTLAYNFD